MGRDLAAYAILKECEAGRGSPNGGAWLSFQHLSKAELDEAFGPIIKKLSANNIDLTKQAIEVAPIAHYHMGGIEVNESMETCVKGLFAAGECVGGANGANRLSGNAIPEAFVFGEIAGANAANTISEPPHLSLQIGQNSLLNSLVELSRQPKQESQFKTLTSRKLLFELQKLMWENVGVLRNKQGLKMAIDKIRKMKNETFPNLRPTSGNVFNTSLMDWLDLRNSLLCAEAICLAANERKESRGAHQMEDIPSKSNKYIKNQIISMIDGNLVSRWQNVQKLKFELEKKRRTRV